MPGKVLTHCYNADLLRKFLQYIVWNWKVNKAREGYERGMDARSGSALVRGGYYLDS